VRTLAPAEAGAGFTDTPPWAADQINWLADNGIANGFDDGSFGPNKNITRAQASYWLSNYNAAITFHQNPDAQITNTFFDVKASCPVGKRPVGGGGSAGFVGIHMVSSAPFGAAWRVLWQADAGPVNPGTLRAYVFCVPDNA
jgi:hypothetical protein